MVNERDKIDLNKNLKKDAKVSLEKREFPDGHVYAFVNGVKQFFPISKVFIDVYGKDVETLINEIKNQREINKKQKEINKILNKRLKNLESKVNKYVG